MRSLIAIAAYYGFKFQQMDVMIAFFNPDVDEEIYIQVPQCFVQLV
jgi:hypothetical protein